MPATTLISQKEAPQADYPYGGKRMKTNGCVPTAIAMALGMTDARPVAKWLQTHGHALNGMGTYLSAVIMALRHYGYSAWFCGRSLNRQMHPTEYETLQEHLRSGRKAIVSTAGTELGKKSGRNAYWGKKAHCICLYGADGGSVLVADPAGLRNGWHRLDDYSGEEEGSLNGNILQILLTDIPIE